MTGQQPYVMFDGMTWPNPSDPLDTEWSLRYGNPNREQMLASMLEQEARRTALADREVTAIREAREEGPECTPPSPSLS